MKALKPKGSTFIAVEGHWVPQDPIFTANSECNQLQDLLFSVLVGQTIITVSPIYVPPFCSNELNLSGTESSFTVVSHRHVQDAPQNPDTLWVRNVVLAGHDFCTIVSLHMQAGGVFRLFHREIECYLVAEGSFVELDEDSDRVTKDGRY